MNTNQIRYFICVAECGSFSKAVDILFLSRQAIIKQINLLEEEVGTPLFIRDVRGVTLTPAGMIFLKHMRDVEQIVSKAIMEARNGVGSKPIVLSYYQDLEESALTYAIQLFRELHPEIPVEYEYNSMDQNQYLENIQNGKLSLCLLPYQPVFETAALNYTHLYYAKPWCLMDRNLSGEFDDQISLFNLNGRKVYTSDSFWAGKIAESCREHQICLEIETIPFTVSTYLSVCKNGGIIICNDEKKNQIFSLEARPLISELRFSYGLVSLNKASEEVELFLEIAKENIR